MNRYLDGCIRRRPIACDARADAVFSERLDIDINS